MKGVICALVVLMSCPLLMADTDGSQKELKALQGKWKVVAVEARGMPLPKGSFPAFTWIIRDDGQTTAQMPTGNFPVTLSVDFTKIPKTFVNLHGSGDQKRTRQYGIYKVEGNRLIVCQTAPGASEGDRPTEFTTKDTPNIAIVFERVRENKEP